MEDFYNTPVDGFQIRRAVKSDVPLILGFIHELAEYEKLSHEVSATEEMLQRTLFGEKPAAEVIIGEYEGVPAAFALFFHNYSTFLGKPGMYLEDLFVKKQFRSRGLGKAMLSCLAAIAVERECGRFEWSVLDWNTPAIEFYHGLGAKPMSEWTVQRVVGDALHSLAEDFRAQSARS